MSTRTAFVLCGSAGRALECDGQIYSGGGSAPWSKDDGGGTPKEGLRAYSGIGMLTSPYDGDVRMPAYAHDTGYRVHDRQLWLTGDPGRAYARTPDGVEAWPLVKAGMGCK
ncbi:hypothetical protein ACWCRD_35070 [Streptomyces sp. NPDC002092]